MPSHQPKRFYTDDELKAFLGYEVHDTDSFADAVQWYGKWCGVSEERMLRLAAEVVNEKIRQ